MPHHSRVISATILSFLLELSIVAADPLPRSEVEKIGKAGTVLVEVKPNGSGTGFCVHPTGWFVTNYHVVRDAPDGEVVVVVDAGQSTQKVLKATVVRQDKELNLALLRVAGDHKLPALALGSDADLVKSTELIALGFPFGTALGGAARKQDVYPPVTVNVTKVANPRTNANKELWHIQLDSTLNMGNVGGPVLDRSGKVVGVIFSWEVVGNGSNLAIPVRLFRQFLDRPDITFTPPAILRGPGGKSNEYEFRASITQVFSDVVFDVDLLMTPQGGKEQKYAMKKDGGAYVALAIPFPDGIPAAAVRLEATFPDGAVKAESLDQEFKVGDQAVKLSEVRRVRPADGTADRINGARMIGAVSGLSAVPVRLGGQKVTLDLGLATEVAIQSPPAPFVIRCAVVVRRGEREVARLVRNVYPEGIPRASLAALTDGKFHQPLPSGTPSTYLRVQSTPGEFTGVGKSYVYQGNECVVLMPGSLVTVRAGGWKGVFAPPPLSALKVEKYENAKRFGAHGDSPGLDFMGNGWGSSQAGGRFVVWELEEKDGQVIRLAIDFIRRSETREPGLVGMLRINSTLE